MRDAIFQCLYFSNEVTHKQNCLFLQLFALNKEGLCWQNYTWLRASLSYFGKPCIIGLEEYINEEMTLQ